MLSQNILNPEKKEKLVGTTFHIFYTDLHTSIFFDKNFNVPIIWGSKNVVMGWVKKLDELLNVPKTTRVKIFSYIFDKDIGFRRVDTYTGPIETIGKFIIRI